MNKLFSSAQMVLILMGVVFFLGCPKQQEQSSGTLQVMNDQGSEYKKADFHWDVKEGKARLMTYRPLSSHIDELDTLIEFDFTIADLIKSSQTIESKGPLRNLTNKYEQQIVYSFEKQIEEGTVKVQITETQILRPIKDIERKQLSWLESFTIEESPGIYLVVDYERNDVEVSLYSGDKLKLKYQGEPKELKDFHLSMKKKNKKK